MDNRFINRNEAHWRIHDLFVQEDAIVSSIPGFKRWSVIFEENLQQIKIKDSGKPDLTEGKTEQKHYAREDLVSAIIIVADAVNNYAAEKKDVELETQSNTNDSFLNSLRDTELSEKSMAILNLTGRIEPALEDHGLAAEGIADAKAKLQAFDAARTGKSQGEETSVVATKTVAQLMSDNSSIVANRFRRYIRNLEGKQPDFCARYHAAKRVVKLSAANKAKAESDATQSAQTPSNPA